MPLLFTWSTIISLCMQRISQVWTKKDECLNVDNVLISNPIVYWSTSKAICVLSQSSEKEGIPKDNPLTSICRTDCFVDNLKSLEKEINLKRKRIHKLSSLCANEREVRVLLHKYTYVQYTPKKSLSEVK